MFSEGLYNRQSKLNLRTRNELHIIGVGGIGSWVAFFAALSGKIRTLHLWDPDTIEMSNLNRTPFRLEDISKYKIDAICEIINERRLNAKLKLIKHKEKVNETTFSEYNYQTISVIDCRDGIFSSDFSNVLNDSRIIKLSYDGLSVTYDNDFKNRTVWGETTGTYTIEPSFLCPCTFLASLAIIDILTRGIDTKKFLTFNIDETLPNLNKAQEIIKKHDDFVKKTRDELDKEINKIEDERKIILAENLKLRDEIDYLRKQLKQSSEIEVN